MDLSVALTAPQPVPSSGRVTPEQSPGAASGSDSSGQSFADALAALSDAINGALGSDEDDDVPAATGEVPSIVVPSDLVPGWAGIAGEASKPEKSCDDLEMAEPEAAANPDDDNGGIGGDAITAAALAAAAAAEQPAAKPPITPVAATSSASASQPGTSESMAANPATAGSETGNADAPPAGTWAQPGESSTHASAMGTARRAEHRAAHRNEGAHAAPRENAAEGSSESVDVSTFSVIDGALHAVPSEASAPMAEGATEKPGLGTPYGSARSARGIVAADLVRAVPGSSSTTNDTPSNDSWSGASSNRSAAAELLARSLRNQAAVKVEAVPQTGELFATVHASSLVAMNGATLVAPGTVESLSSGLSASALPGETATQIVQAMRLQAAQGGGTAHIRLEPEHFGELSVTIKVDRGQVVARLEAEVPAVREWLQNNQALLRSNLAEHSLTLDRLEVAESRNEQRRDGERSGNPRGDQPRQRRRKPDTGELFEVVA